MARAGLGVPDPEPEAVEVAASDGGADAAHPLRRRTTALSGRAIRRVARVAPWRDVARIFVSMAQTTASG
jgi:hypothetical protein